MFTLLTWQWKEYIFLLKKELTFWSEMSSELNLYKSCWPWECSHQEKIENSDCLYMVSDETWCFSFIRELTWEFIPRPLCVVSPYSSLSLNPNGSQEKAALLHQESRTLCSGTIIFWLCNTNNIVELSHRILNGFCEWLAHHMNRNIWLQFKLRSMWDFWVWKEDICELKVIKLNSLLRIPMCKV